MLRCKGYARCFFSVAGLPRSKLRQADYGEETAFVPQACITARKTMKAGWRGPCPYKPIKPIRLTCPLRAADLTGSGHQCYGSVFKVFLCVCVIIRQRRICRVRRYFLVHHIEHPIKRPTPKTTQSPTPKRPIPSPKKEGETQSPPRHGPKDAQSLAGALLVGVGPAQGTAPAGGCGLCAFARQNIGGADNLLTLNSFRLASSKFQLPKA